ncbi:MAG TPA: hypothetical protein VGE97_09370 [Nitrososphaera sp.]|jgi:hypothetical protein
MESEFLVNFCASQLASRLENFNDSKAIIFTCFNTEQRQIGFKVGNQEFTIEINVKEAS